MVGSEWLAGFGDEERQMLAWRGVKHCLQVRMHRNPHRLAGLLLFHHMQPAVLEVLAAHANHIGTALPGVEQQCEREARLRADRMMRLELLDLIFRPRVESVALDKCELDVCGRVAAQVAALAPKLAKRAQRREPTARRVRWLAVE